MPLMSLGSFFWVTLNKYRYVPTATTALLFGEIYIVKFALTCYFVAKKGIIRECTEENKRSLFIYFV